MKTKTTNARPIRRVVTGQDAQGRSLVISDAPAPNDHQNLGISRYFTDIWVWNDSPAPLSGHGEAGDGPYEFPSPPDGGHLRVVEWPAKPRDYDPATDTERVPVHEAKHRPPGKRTWDKGGNDAYTSAIHKTETVDYGIVLAGERELILDDRELVMRPGDTIIQVASWHQWRWTRPDTHGLMAFDFVAARFDNIHLGEPPKPVPMPALPEGVKPARRIVTVDRGPGEPNYVWDGPSHDVRIDPARPGFASARLWVTDATPAKIEFETLHLPHSLEPPGNGSVLRIVTHPPDALWQGRVGPTQVREHFERMGSPGALVATPSGPHPYLQQTATLDFCIVLEGELALVLDSGAVRLQAGEIAVVRGNRHAWSNPTRQPAVVAIASHAGRR